MAGDIRGIAGVPGLQDQRVGALGGKRREVIRGENEGPWEHSTSQAGSRSKEEQRKPARFAATMPGNLDARQGMGGQLLHPF